MARRLINILLFVFISGFFFGNLFAWEKESGWSEPANLSILNTPEDDFAPVWNRFENALYFNSTVTGYSLFNMTEPLDSLNFSAPKLVEGEVNQRRNNQSYITFLSDNTAYISTYRQTETHPFLNIFQTRRKKTAWTKPFPVDSLLYDGFAAHPAVSPDGSIIIYSTVRNSDYGDTDLWMAFRQDNGGWTSAISLTELNSPGNEITPFLATNDTLYFASDGQEGPGGYDLFMSVRSGGEWQRPYPLVAFNTEFDESDLTFLSNGTAIFASNRPGGKGKLDLYLSIPETIKIPKVAPSAVLFDIATQTDKVDVVSELAYREFPVIPYIFMDDYIFFENMNDWKIWDEAQLPESIDSIYKYSLLVILKRMSQGKESELYVILPDNSQESGAYANKIKEFAQTRLNINSDRIKIRIDESLSQSSEKIIKYESDDDNLFRPLYLGTGKTLLEPPVLELYLDARPRNMVKKWSLSLCFDESNILVKESVGLPAELQLDLTSYTSSVKESDSLKLVISGLDTLDRAVIGDRIIYITHRTQKKKNTVKLNGRESEQYLFFFAGKAEFGKNYKSLTDDITASASMPLKQIIIQYFSKENPQSLRNAESMKAELEKLIPSNTSKKIEFIQWSSTLPFSNEFSPKIIRVLLEYR